MVKDSRKGVERPLKASDLGRCNEAVITIEKRQEGLDCRAQALLYGTLLGVPHYCHPVTDDNINKHVKNCG